MQSQLVSKQNNCASKLTLQPRSSASKKELIQSQLAELRCCPAARGDLTVYSRVDNGEIGIVANLFNSIIESLREIVIEVKSSGQSGQYFSNEDEAAICSLARDANQQSVEINILELVEQRQRRCKS